YSLFMNETAPPVFYPLSLHDALPISRSGRSSQVRRFFGTSIWKSRFIARPFSNATASGGLDSPRRPGYIPAIRSSAQPKFGNCRSEEHTSELQPRGNLVRRPLPETKN